MMKLRLLTLALILAVVGTTAAVPMSVGATAPAARTAQTTNGTTPANTLTAVPIGGTVSGGHGKAHQRQTFKGFLYVDRFADQGGKLVAIGTVSGVLTNPGGKVYKTVNAAPVTLPVSSITSGGTSSTGSSGSSASPAGRAEQAAGCQILHLNLGPLMLNLLGLHVNLNRVVLDITAIPGAGNLLGNLLCGVANLLNGGLNLGSLADLLNSILGSLRPTTSSSPFTNIPLVGAVGSGAGGTTGAMAPRSLHGQTAQGQDTFVGLFSITQFITSTTGLVAKGQVTHGLFSDGKTLPTQEITVPVTLTTSAPSATSSGMSVPQAMPAARAAASCGILYLNLAPTALNLLGLQVNLSRVILNITAVQGAGNLLGNLLCAVTGLLNGAGARSPVGDAARPNSRPRDTAPAIDYSQLADKMNALLAGYPAGTVSAPLSAIPITGNGRGHATFKGLFDVQGFTQDASGHAVAVGVLSGVISGAGSKSGLVQQSNVMLPLANGGASGATGAGTSALSQQGRAEASCNILNLVLGPLNLNLLGLKVTLNRVVLNITAQSGPGNLLGNLLCGIAGLLNGASSGLLGDLETLLGLFT